MQTGGGGGGGGSSAVDGGTDADGGTLPLLPADALDLLVLVDNSNSMREEQSNLGASFPELIAELVDPPDEDLDGAPDRPAIDDLQIGVISTDMGTSGRSVTTCDDAADGDDGVLLHAPSPSVAGCDAAYPTFLTYEADAPDADLATGLECIATLGTGGCGFEQHLFAVEKAVTEHAAPGGPNEGFVRPNAVLAILLLTDEDDCSVADPAIFGADDALGPLMLRCFEHPEMVRPVDELVDGVLEAKPGHPERVVVAAIVGIPPYLDGQDFQTILDAGEMEEEIDVSAEGGGARLVPSCDVAGLGVAFPPRRLVAFARGVAAAGGGGVAHSICRSDLRPAARDLARLAAARMGP